MNRTLLNKIADRKKVNLSQYDYVIGFEHGRFTYVLFGVRCSTTVAAPLTREEFKFRTSSLLKKWENGEEDPDEYLTDGWEGISYMK